MYKNSNQQKFRSTKIQICKNSDIQKFRCTKIQIYKNSDDIKLVQQLKQPLLSTAVSSLCRFMTPE